MTHKPTHIISNPEYFSDMDWQYFQPEFWRKRDAITGHAKGRGISYFFEFENRHFVLKEYLRGGVIGKLIHNHYLYTNREQARSFSEFNLLEWMHAQGLPVPDAGGAILVKENRFVYRASLITTKIEHARDLKTLLKTDTLSPEMWRRIGHTIARFHQAGVCHSDLSAGNILIDNAEKIWLIDFDQSYQRAIASFWQLANLNRLQRSLVKESMKSPGFTLESSYWQHLLNGYRDKR